ncbi:hypothetical protein KW850_27490 [Bacillus sp. sid0103]|uniref:hypothetical protein n=1 Tax=Bacillus sp. sid0103 TaxID=2856337 RepID=UPI001C475D01|nr:hypothetical protein [Bacillus sp. sid0103]MBV7508951.1 hypothetical protein [Bacillus sp. sid0103]
MISETDQYISGNPILSANHLHGRLSLSLVTIEVTFLPSMALVAPFEYRWSDFFTSTSYTLYGYRWSHFFTSTGIILTLWLPLEQFFSSTGIIRTV